MSKRQEYRLFLILHHSNAAEVRFKRENLNKHVQMSFSRLFSIFQILTLSCIIKEKNYSGGKNDGIKNIIGRIRKKQRQVSFNLRDGEKVGQI